MNALACAFALWGLLAFAAFVLWLRTLALGESEADRIQRHVDEIRRLLMERIDTQVRLVEAGEDRRRKLSKRVGDLEFRSLGKRMTPAEDDS